MSPRRFVRLVLLLVLAAAAGCGRGESERMGPDIVRALALGRARAEAWVALGRGSGAGDAEPVLALGYLERLRLGLGSPFRLIDYALHDPRLDDSTRVELAWALLARTMDREAYQIDAAGLDRVGLAGVGARPGIGRQHLELIEGAVTRARDPRSGEMAVRLAYALLAAEHTVAQRAPALSAQAAALIRDREVARADAIRLVYAARSAGADPIRMVPAWRTERRFEVEQPPLAALPLEVEREAMELAPRLAAAVEALAPRLAGTSRPGGVRPGTLPLLGVAAARRLGALADSLNAPPQTAIAIAVDVHRRDFLDRPSDGVAEVESRRRFLENARNEERFVAEHALLVHRGGAAGGALARATLAAAVGLRTFAQEQVWFPGFPGPTTRQLEDRFGLASVRFDDDVPAAWRPYYRRMVGESLADLQRVLPSLQFKGLRVRIGEARIKAATLAIHDPRGRTIVLPPTTGAGTIAHEVAHDLDWQVALRRYRVRGDYGSDRALRLGGDRLAATVQRLSTATLMPPVPGGASPVTHALRPAEVFARSVDWFVAASLAHEGRVNGYLSSVQDDLLTGYGTVTPPDITGDAGEALVTILDEVAPVYPATRDWFLRSYGPRRALTPYDLVRRVVEAAAAEEGGAPPAEEAPAEEALAEGDGEQVLRLEAAGAAARQFDAVVRARDAALAAIDTWICRAPSAVYDPRIEIARRQLVARAAGARGRGLALRFAGDLAGEDGQRWLARQFFGAPWPSASLDEQTQALVTTLLERARALGEVQIAPAPGAFRLATSPRRCAAPPLLSAGDR